MTREEFDSLDIHDQIRLANEELIKDPLLSIKRLRDEILNIPKTTWGDRIKKYGYKYDQNIRQYISNTNVLHDNIIESKEPKEISKVTGNKLVSHKINNTNILQLDNTITNDILELINIKADLVRIVDEYKRNTNVIDVSELKIDHSKLTGEVKLTTVRLYSDVIDKFKDFADSYKEFSKQDLYSIALYEFIEKYKK